MRSFPDIIGSLTARGGDAVHLLPLIQYSLYPGKAPEVLFRYVPSMSSCMTQ